MIKRCAHMNIGIGTIDNEEKGLFRMIRFRSTAAVLILLEIDYLIIAGMLCQTILPEGRWVGLTLSAGRVAVAKNESCSYNRKFMSSVSASRWLCFIAVLISVDTMWSLCLILI